MCEQYIVFIINFTIEIVTGNDNDQNDGESLNLTYNQFNHVI